MIELQFAAQRDLCSAAICWFGAGHVSHVDAVMPDGRLFGARSDRVGGQPAGVWPRPRNYARFSRIVTATIASNPAQERAFWGFLNRQKGLPYDRLAILGFAFGRDWRQEEAWICSELIARAFEVAAVFPRPLYLAAAKVTPVALALAVSALPGVTFQDG